MIEVGVPYSDPLADGPTIQAAASRALEKKVTLVLLMLGKRMSPLLLTQGEILTPLLLMRAQSHLLF